jgi:Uma2 family endonuclease
VSVDPVPDWMRPENGFFADDLDHLPGLPPHTELIDGGLVLMSPQKFLHMKLVSRIHVALSQAAPAGLEALQEMSIVLNDRQRPEPDVAVIDASFLDPQATWFPAAAVLLAVEVVAPESEVRDRERKPQLYARAGITHFWRVETTTDAKPIVYVYELDPATSTYALSGIHHDQLKLEVPFPINIDFTVT